MIDIELFRQLAQNKVFVMGLLSWFLAQLLKIVFDLLLHQKLNLKLFFQSGGMPSSHSAIVCAVSVGVGRIFSFASPHFALGAVLALIVMYDAMGVRRATGEQAKVLNDLIDMMNIHEKVQIKLKEVLGHTPFQVLSGAALGIIIGSVMPI